MTMKTRKPVTEVEWEPELAGLTAGDIMNPHVASVPPHATLMEVADVLAQRRISAVPVVEADGTVVGIVSESDLIDEEKRRVRLPRTMLFGVFPALEDAVRAAYEGGSALTAQDLMTKHVTTLPEHASARAAADEMIERRINHLPITRDGKLAGIIARSDVLGAIQAEWRKPRTVVVEGE